MTTQYNLNILKLNTLNLKIFRLYCCPLFNSAVSILATRPISNASFVQHYLLRKLSIRAYNYNIARCL